MKKLGLVFFFWLSANYLWALLPGFEENIHITSDPSGATVYLSDESGKNYKKIGTTPLTKVIKIGSKIKIEKEGYDTKLVDIIDTVFALGKVNVTLKQSPEQNVQIDSKPSDAEVYLLENEEAKYLGKTPLNVKIKVGKKQIKIVKKGFKDHWGEIDSALGKPYLADLGEESHPGFYENGNADLKINCTPEGKAYLIDKNSFIALILLQVIIEGAKNNETYSENQLKQMSQKITQLMAAAILQNEEGKDLVETIYNIGDLQKNAPLQLNGIKASTYFVWVVSNGKVSYSEVTLGENDSKTVSFDHRDRYLMIESNPDKAKIFINGIEQDYQTPKKFRVTGTDNPIEVSVYKEGYEDSNGYEKPTVKFNLYPGDDKTVSFSLKESKYGKVSVSADTDDAEVYLNNSYQGKTPFTSNKIKAGSSVQIEVRKENYLTSRKTVDIQADETVSADFDLEALFLGNQWRIGGGWRTFDNENFKRSYDKLYGGNFGFFPMGSGLDMYWNNAFYYNESKSGYGKMLYGETALGATLSYRVWQLIPYAGVGLKAGYLKESIEINGQSLESEHGGWGYEWMLGTTLMLSGDFGFYFNYRKDFLKMGEKAYSVSGENYEFGMAIGTSAIKYSEPLTGFFSLYSVEGLSNGNFRTELFSYMMQTETYFIEVVLAEVFLTDYGFGYFGNDEKVTGKYVLPVSIGVSFLDYFYLGTKLYWLGVKDEENLKNYDKTQIDLYLKTIDMSSYFAYSLQTGVLIVPSESETKFYASMTVYFGFGWN